MAVKLRKKRKKLRRKELERLAVALTAVLLLLLIPLFFWKQEGSDAPTHPTGTESTLTLPPASLLEPNPYCPEDFTYRDGYLSLKDGSGVLGVDVSSHQGAIDWLQVAEAGFEFALIRVGYRGYGNGTLVADELAQSNYEGARAAGLKVGAYIFSQAISVEEALEEAEFFLEQTAGWQLDMPVVFDWEYISEEARTAQVDGATVTACTLAFCREMEKNGLMPMIYFNLNLAVNYLDLEQLQDYRFWLALYSDEMTYPYKIDFWQYTQAGRVPGISTDVDINLLLP